MELKRISKKVSVFTPERVNSIQSDADLKALGRFVYDATKKQNSNPVEYTD